MNNIIFDSDRFWNEFCEWENNNRKDFEVQIEHMVLNAIELRLAQIDWVKVWNDFHNFAIFQSDCPTEYSLNSTQMDKIKEFVEQQLMGEK